MVCSTNRFREPLVRDSVALGDAAANDQRIPPCGLRRQSQGGAIDRCFVPSARAEAFPEEVDDGGVRRTASRAATARLLALISASARAPPSTGGAAAAASSAGRAELLRCSAADSANDASSVSSKGTAGGDGASSVASLDTCGSATEQLLLPSHFQKRLAAKRGVPSLELKLGAIIERENSDAEDSSTAATATAASRDSAAVSAVLEPTAVAGQGSEGIAALRHPPPQKLPSPADAKTKDASTPSAGGRVGSGSCVRGRNLLALLQGRSVGQTPLPAVPAAHAESPREQREQQQSRPPARAKKEAAGRRGRLSEEWRGAELGRSGAFASSAFMRSPDASAVPLPLFLAHDL